MTQEKTPAAVETTTSAQDSAILANRAAWRKTGVSCYICVKPKGPVRRNTSDNAVAAPTDKRGFVMSEFVRTGATWYGMVLGRWACPRGWPHGVIRVSNICPPAARRNATSGFLSHNGAKTMTKAVNLVRPAAPIISMASRRAAPIKSALDTNSTEVIGLHAAATNALAAALRMLRDPACTADDLQRATARVIRAGTLMRRACSAAQEGGAA